MARKLRITVPKAIWSGDFDQYRTWCWETYGRYISKPGEVDNPIDVDMEIKFARF